MSYKLRQLQLVRQFQQLKLKQRIILAGSAIMLAVTICIGIFMYANLGTSQKAYAAANRYAVANGNWNATSTWSSSSGGSSGASIPVAGDNVYIGEAATDRTVTIPSGYSAACATVTLGNTGDNTKATLAFSASSSTLTASGNVKLNRPNANADVLITLGAGSLTVGGNLELGNNNGSGNQGNRVSKITISTGTLNISGGIIFSGFHGKQSQIEFTGAGTMNLAGNMTFTNGLGSIVPSTSTINFNGTSAQTIPFNYTDPYLWYNNITINNTSVGGATLDGTSAGAYITGNVQVVTGLLSTGNYPVELAANKSLTVNSNTTLNAGTSVIAWTGSGGSATINGTFQTANTVGFSNSTTTSFKSTNNPTVTLGSSSTVEYNGGAQTVTSRGDYANLILSGSGAKTLTNVTAIAGDLTIKGSATATIYPNTTVGGNVSLSGTSALTTSGSVSDQLTIDGNLTIGNGTTFTSTGNVMTVAGITTVGGGTSGSLVITAVSATNRIFNGLVTINAGGSFTNTAVGGANTTFKGGITKSATGTFDHGGGNLVIFNNNNQALTGSFTIPSMNINSTVTLTNNESLTTVNVGTASNTGTLKQAANSTLTITGSFGSTQSLDASAVGNTVTYSGTAQTIKSATYHHLVLSGSGAKTMTGVSAINGNFTLAGTASATAATGITIGGNVTIGSGTTFDASSFTHHIKGNWINSGGTFTPSTSTLIFDGNSAQTTTALTSNNLTVDNGSTLTPSGNITVNGILTFTSGILVAGANTVTVSNSAYNSVMAGSGNTNYTQSWINGTLIRSFISGSTDTYDFPVGNGTKGRPASIKSNSLAGVTSFSAYFRPLNPGNNSQLNAWETSIHGNPYHTPYTSVNSAGGWVIEPDATPTSGTYDIKLFFNGFSGMLDNKFGILKRPANSSTFADFKPDGGTVNGNGAAGRMITDGYALRMGLRTFSEFGIGQSGNVLPIKLISFTAERVENSSDVELKWSTASEINNDHFELEVATNSNSKDDNLTFSKIAEVKGNGTSTIQHNYSFIDAEAAKSGTWYYRLKQVDFDGKFTYSEIKSVSNPSKSNSPQTVITISPNPASTEINVNMQVQQNMETNIEIVDLSGRLVYKKHVQLSAGTNDVKLPLTDLARGVYFIRYTNNHAETLSQKFVKE